MKTKFISATYVRLKLLQHCKNKIILFPISIDANKEENKHPKICLVWFIKAIDETENIVQKLEIHPILYSPKTNQPQNFIDSLSYVRMHWIPQTLCSVAVPLQPNCSTVRINKTCDYIKQIKSDARNVFEMENKKIVRPRK